MASPGLLLASIAGAGLALGGIIAWARTAAPEKRGSRAHIVREANHPA